jgi:alpha-D-ribose 1-methylphosphonate 5-triphosphate diphosphatase
VLETALGSRAATADALVDHRLLLRLDARDPMALAALRLAVERLYDPAGPLPLVSFEDHTPGQGQYADAEYFRLAMRDGNGLSEAEATARFDALVEDRESRKHHREAAMRWLSGQALAGRIRLLAHDPVNAEEIARASAQGVAVAEFPTTLEAAAAAKEHGLPVVAGAPNVLRGRSHSGNVSATELIGAGLVDALASDYMPSTLLAAVLSLADQGVVGLPRAVRLVTAGAAAVVGLSDRGALVPGLRSDLTVVTVAGGWPTVRLVLLADEQRADSPQPQLIHATAGAR